MQRIEKETIIIFNEAKKEAEVFSCTPSIWKKCQRCGGKLKDEDYYQGKLISQTYILLNKKYIRISKIARKKLSEEQKQVLRERVKKARAAKSQTR